MWPGLTTPEIGGQDDDGVPGADRSGPPGAHDLPMTNRSAGEPRDDPAPDGDGAGDPPPSGRSGSGAEVQARLREAVATLGADAGVVALVTGRTLIRLSSIGYGPDAFGAWPLPLTGSGPLVAAARDGRPVWIVDGAELEAAHPDLNAGADHPGDASDEPVPGAGGFVPLVEDGRILGVLGVTFRGEHPWPPEERVRLDAAAAGLVAPLHHLDAAERRRRVTGQLDDLPAEPSVQARLDRAARLVSSALDDDIVVLALTSPDGEWLERFGIHHPDPVATDELRHLMGERVRVGENRSSRTLLDGHSVVIAEMDPDEFKRAAVPRLAPFLELWPVHGTISVPLPGPAGETVGLLTAMRLRPGDPYSRRERQWLEAVAPQLGRLVPAAAGPAGEGRRAVATERLLPLAGKPLGVAVALALPLLLTAALRLADEPGLRPSAGYLACIAAVAAVAGRREAAITTIVALGLYWNELSAGAALGADPRMEVGALLVLAVSAMFVVLLVDRLERAARSLVDLERRDADRRHQETAERLVATERQALADSRFRSLVEATTSVTWRANPDGELVEPQPGWEAYTGQPWAEQAGRGWGAMIHPDDRPAVEAAWAGNLERGRAVFEMPVRLWSERHHEHRHAVARAAPLWDRHGRIIEWIGAVSDIHEQVQAHERADRAAALLDTLTRQAPVGFGFLDTGGRYHLVNDALAAIDGRPETEHAGRRPDEVSPTTAAIAPLVASVLATGEAVLDTTITVGNAAAADDGPAPWRELMVSVYPVRAPDGQLLGAGTTVVEVTEQNRLARELSESRARLAALMDADVLAFIHGEDERITYANDAFLDMIGRTRDELESGALRWTELTAPGWEEADGAALDQLARQGRADPYEKEYLDAHGHPVPVEIGVVAITTTPLRWTAYVVDLRERKAVEQRLRDAYDQRDHVARTLQTSLLPPTLPQPEGLRFAARYLPSPVGEGVGGDFYDVYPSHAGHWHVAIGDVCGRGTDAAALTALSRYTLRAAAIAEEDPREILRVLNDAVRSTVEDGRFCTVSYTVLRPEPGLRGPNAEAGVRGPNAEAGLRGPNAEAGLPARWRATVTLGGHHPLRILRAGEVTTVGRPGTLIGVFPEARFNAVDVVLDPGDIVVAFTDGLIEQQRPPFDEADLDALLARLAKDGADLDTVVATLESQVAAEAVRDDDTAILAFTVL
jgi:PAS domain S-box-containing protein